MNNLRKIIFFLLFVFGFLIQISLTTIPIILDLILILYIFNKKTRIYFIAFFLGIILDIFSLRQVGTTSLFFVIFLFIINLYENKFEINTIPFVLFFSFFGSLAFLLVLRENYFFWQAIVSSIFSMLLFTLIKKLTVNNYERM